MKRKQTEINLKEGWSSSNEAEWTRYYLNILEDRLASLEQKLPATMREIRFHTLRLRALEEEEQYWQRFIKYCQTGK
jgi:hypothetical protein